MTDAERSAHLFGDAGHVGVDHVDFVRHGEDGEVLFEGEVKRGDGLRLDALRGVHEEERAVARGERSRDFKGEIRVARGVDEVEEVPAVRAGAVVEQGHGLGFDGDAARALDGEAVEVLFAAAGRDRAGELHEAVGEGGFAVVDVRDDGEGADVLEGDGEVLVGGTLRGENLAIRERCRRAGLGRVRGAGRRAGRGREGARRREGKDAVPTREGRRRGKRAERRGARAPRPRAETTRA